MNNVLFLHTQLSGYFLSSLEYAVEKDESLLIHIVAFPNTNDAPFRFNALHERIKLYNRYDFNKASIRKLIDSISPISIYVGGWSERSYLQVIKKYRNKIPLTIAMDNLWYGIPRQYLACILSRIFIVRLFDFIWVPGKPQAIYAKKLGFKENKILSHFYCADLNLFRKYYNKSKYRKEMEFPHKFLFVGRYVSEKGLSNLWEAFEKLQQERPSDWELICVGTGPLFEFRIRTEKIDHRGFLQPEELEQIISETGVFVLPSWEEHWGVVLHEFAAAGYPLISSDAVGATSTFLKDQLNGYFFNCRDVNSLKDKMQKIINQSDTELIQMGRQSNLLSESITQEQWFESFKKINLSSSKYFKEN